MTVDIDRLRELAEAATPGPWYAALDYYGGPSIRTTPKDGNNIDGSNSIWENTGRAAGDPLEEDVAYIAAANPQAIIELVARLKSSDAYAEAMEATWRLKERELEALGERLERAEAELAEYKAAFNEGRPWVKTTRSTPHP